MSLGEDTSDDKSDNKSFSLELTLIPSHRIIIVHVVGCQEKFSFSLLFSVSDSGRDAFVEKRGIL